MSQVVQMPRSIDRIWRREGRETRDYLVSKGVGPEAVDRILEEFQDYHRVLHFSVSVKFTSRARLSPEQQEIVDQDVDEVVGRFQDDCRARVRLAKDIILLLLMEKHS